MNRTFFVDPDSHAARQAEEWEETRPEDAALMTHLASHPRADWFGDWTADPETEIGGRVTQIVGADALPVLVFYTMPYRDCGLYSAGGANDPNTYREWIAAAAAGIGDRPAVVILEPDALALTDCLTEEQTTERYELLRFAIDVLEGLPQTDVYLDAGNAGWLVVGDAATRLDRAGIAKATGFALNVSNFQTTSASTDYGHAVSAAITTRTDTPFVIDTSRNGNGPWEANDPETWCNPPGRALGHPPTTSTGEKLVDAWLWVKVPGESDGECRGHPPAGQWDPEYALDLVRNADLP
jgi:endoglucanase